MKSNKIKATELISTKSSKSKGKFTNVPTSLNGAPQQYTLVTVYNFILETTLCNITNSTAEKYLFAFSFELKD